VTVPTNKKHRRALLWMRRALRVDDNAALWHALAEADEVVPVLVLSDDSSYSLDTGRRRFVRRAIADLDAGLRARGSCLHVRIGPPEIELPAAANGYNADAVYAVRLYDEPARRRDARIVTALRRSGTQLVQVKDRVLREADELRTHNGGPYRVFTPYKRRWLESAPEHPRPFPDSGVMVAVPMAPGSIPLQRAPGFDRPLTDTEDFSPLLRLERFLGGPVAMYNRRRDLPAVDGTSRLSHHLSLGTISPRRVYWAARETFHGTRGGARTGIETFVSELIWREFYYQILAAYPFVLDTAFREEFRGIPWRRSTSAFARWKSGTTGYPIVDAAMRQLEEEGWMHNRARMIAASFLTKDLHLSWQWGERYFAEKLVDLDLASNNGGWQWTAGTGTDASPWFRIFNPVLQGKKFDPDGTYVQRYVPELARVPAYFVHEPWRMTQQDQESYGCRLGKQYPHKVVEHAEERGATQVLYSDTRRR
jgi:deoxyribodipyrimidine photo-lyase